MQVHAISRLIFHGLGHEAREDTEARRDGTDSALHPYDLIAIGERVVGISDINLILRRCGFFQYALVGQVLNRKSLSQNFEQPSMLIQSAQSVEITAGA